MYCTKIKVKYAVLCYIVVYLCEAILCWYTYILGHNIMYMPEIYVRVLFSYCTVCVSSTRKHFMCSVLRYVSLCLILGRTLFAASKRSLTAKCLGEPRSRSLVFSEEGSDLPEVASQESPTPLSTEELQRPTLRSPQQDPGYASCMYCRPQRDHGYASCSPHVGQRSDTSVWMDETAMSAAISVK